MGIKDIAKEAGVSVATVSRVLNGTKYVSEDLRQRVLACIQKEGYVANHVARSMVLKKTFTCGLIIPEVSDLYHQMIFTMAERVLEEAGYKSLVCRVKDTVSSVGVYLGLLLENRVDGLVLMHETSNPRVYEQLKKTQIPIVLAGIDIPDLPFPQVRIDDYQASYDATAHLLSRGKKRIALIGGWGYSVGDKRLEGYKTALDDAGIPFDPSLVVPGYYTVESGWKAMQQLLASGVSFDAVFVQSDEMAIGVMRAALDAGLSIPKDVSVMGFDGIALGKYLNPTLSSVSQPIEEIGIQAAKLLLSLLEGRDVPPLTLLAHTIQEGESVG
ncbi:MAG TPA: LacI family DNA-binding transcriptional regulator [Sphaerochaeta sp.]|jgi:LacI family transcriptional regulator|nr:LacI family DNA-binding transcriptional regulator [Spirochaetota bacterium]NLV60527.1 LacI family transcriptional regulator [Spirochaetales bacterium]HPY12292.1 LacI family DNA-binding transcriptional regulator [Sphaerochaeta sp.]HQB90557.1 LacI family DNA-binding transcriptional regulator [Sphaerochaeta sp.]